jgi:large subunit ribosomal protein L7/L12
MSELGKSVLLVTLLCAASALAEESNWSVTLTELGDQKISVIKIVREHTGLGLKEAKDLVEAPKPKLIKEGLLEADADALVAELITKGAKAEAQQAGARKPARGPRAARADALFEVRLDETGANKILVIKVVRQLTGLGLKEAKTVVESTPIVIKEGAERDVAQKMANDLIEAGAKVTLTPKKP